jgi:hypothetical protein
MTEKEFEELMSLADYLVLSNDYLIGYQKGLRRHYYGESYGTEIEYYQWLNLDGFRAEMGIGYKDGFSGNPPCFLYSMRMD